MYEEPRKSPMGGECVVGPGDSNLQPDRYEPDEHPL